MAVSLPNEQVKFPVYAEGFQPTAKLLFFFTPHNIYCVYFQTDGDLAVSQPSEQVQEALKQLSGF